MAQVFGERSRCDLSPIPAAQCSGCTAGAPSQADGDCPEPQEVLAKKPACSLVDNASLGLRLPLPALAACHRRGMVCSRLVLFSPLFCAQAWLCLRAFCVVAIPQSGLLAQVSSFRLPSGHSGQILTLSSAAGASLPSPHLLVAGAGVCTASPLGELPLGS